jgi:hypothetical protein
MPKTRSLAPYLVTLLLLGMSCGGDDADTNTWPQKSRSERLSHMNSEVLPQMQALFVSHDAAAYANFGCASCHGANYLEVDYAMPSSSLEPLDPDNLPTDDPLGQFMASTVVPKMAELLDTTPATAEKPNGYNCFGCHPSK